MCISSVFHFYFENLAACFSSHLKVDQPKRSVCAAAPTTTLFFTYWLPIVCSFHSTYVLPLDWVQQLLNVIFIWYFRIRKFPGQTEPTLSAEVELISTIAEKKSWTRPPIQMEFQVPKLITILLLNHVEFILFCFNAISFLEIYRKNIDVLEIILLVLL